MAGALNTFYSRRGFILLNKKVSHGHRTLSHILTDLQGTPVQDAFRRGLGHAIQWYDNLQLQMEQNVDQAVLNADKACQDLKWNQAIPEATQNLATIPIPAATSIPAAMLISATMPIPATTPTSATTPFPSPTQLTQAILKPLPLTSPTKPPLLTPGQCARILQQRCPACFGGLLFGRLPAR